MAQPTTRKHSLWRGDFYCMGFTSKGGRLSYRAKTAHDIYMYMYMYILIIYAPGATLRKATSVRIRACGVRVGRKYEGGRKSGEAGQDPAAVSGIYEFPYCRKSPGRVKTSKSPNYSGGASWNVVGIRLVFSRCQIVMGRSGTHAGRLISLVRKEYVRYRLRD